MRFQRTLRKAQRNGLNVSGLRFFYFRAFNKGIQKLDNIARKAKASQADALIVGGHYEEAVNMSLSLKRISWRPKAYFASVGPVIQKFYDFLGNDANYTFSSSHWEHHGGARPSGCDEFYELYIKTYNKNPHIMLQQHTPEARYWRLLSSRQKSLTGSN